MSMICGSYIVCLIYILYLFVVLMRAEERKWCKIQIIPLLIVHVRFRTECPKKHQRIVCIDNNSIHTKYIILYYMIWLLVTMCCILLYMWTNMITLHNSDKSSLFMRIWCQNAIVEKSCNLFIIGTSMHVCNVQMYNIHTYILGIVYKYK